MRGGEWPSFPVRLPKRISAYTKVINVTETRIKPNQEQLAEQERRAEQARQFRRNQAIGLVILAVPILLWWLLHTHPGWIFPPGWWRP